MNHGDRSLTCSPKMRIEKRKSARLPFLCVIIYNTEVTENDQEQVIVINITIKGSPGSISEAPFFFDYAPMQLVAPRAVSTAEMIEASICSVHFSVSFLLIAYLLSILHNIFQHRDTELQSFFNFQ